MADQLTPQQRSRLMGKVKGKNTSIEVLLRSELHKRGLRFRKHVKTLAGTPDIVFPSSKTVVFVDGDFWHGYNFDSWKDKLNDFWRAKIERNIERDTMNSALLRESGWLVIQVWQHEIKKNLQETVDMIEHTVRSR